MKKIKKDDMKKNISSIMTVGDSVLILCSVVGLICSVLGIYLAVDYDNLAPFFIYSMICPLIYWIIGFVLRTFCRWPAYILKILLDIKDGVYINNKPKEK